MLKYNGELCLLTYFYFFTYNLERIVKQRVLDTRVISIYFNQSLEKKNGKKKKSFLKSVPMILIKYVMLKIF